MGRARAALIVMVLCALAPTTPARADDTAADSAIDRGVSLRREHRDAEALVEFRRAYAIDPTPRALAQIGLAEAALEQWVGAEEDLLHALGVDDPWIARQRPAIRLALDEIGSHLATLALAGPDGAELLIDGELVARLPRAVLRVPAKRLVLELRAAGFQVARRDVDLLPTSTVHIAFALEPLAAAPPTTVASPGPEVEPRTAAPNATGVPHVTVKSGASPAAWSVAAGAGLSVVAGAALDVYALNRASYYNGSSCADMPSEPRSTRCPGARSEALTAQTAAFVSYGIAGAGAIVSAVLFLTPWRHLPERAGTLCGPMFAGATCAWAF
jgi:hypothetical protein